MASYDNMVSLDCLPNTRRIEVSSQAQHQRSLAKIQKYFEDPVDEEHLILQDTKAYRRKLMGDWKQEGRILSQCFRRALAKAKLDVLSCTRHGSRRHLCGLCEESKMADAQTKAFFSDYVEKSMRDVMVLGPEDYVTKRAVNSAATCLAMWRKLVKEADLTI